MFFICFPKNKYLKLVADNELQHVVMVNKAILLLMRAVLLFKANKLDELNTRTEGRQ